MVFAAVLSGDGKELIRSVISKEGEFEVRGVEGENPQLHQFHREEKRKQARK